jgi:uncharacterized surface protein with fasciclin (FAS1) repeats
VNRIRLIATAVLTGGIMVTALAGPVAAKTPSVADVLAADGVAFDHNWHDFDIVEKAALTVLDAKPNSPVSALTDPQASLTVFAPTDRAFQVLVHSLTGRWYQSEKVVFNKLVQAVSGLVGPSATIDTIEAVLLYHVVPGKVMSSAVPGLDGADVTTAGGGTFRINVGDHFVRLIDQDPDAKNATLISSKLDIPAGNSVIHGVSRVLRPIDLPSWR